MTISPRELLEQGVLHLVDERRIVSGIAVSYGDRTRGEAFCRGRIREVRLEGGAFVPDEAPMDADSVFDLASGAALAGPATEALAPFGVRVEGGDVLEA